MSGCECKPGAERKRDSAQPQERAQPSKKGRSDDHELQKCEDRQIRHYGVREKAPSDDCL
jgi:hypothetical protein